MTATAFYALLGVQVSTAVVAFALLRRRGAR